MIALWRACELWINLQNRTMMALLIFFSSIPALIFSGLFLSGMRSKKLLVSIPLTFFCLPLLLGYGIYLVRAPIQQGKVLSCIGVGPLLNLVCPPDDLYVPLAEEPLKSTKKTYLLKGSHKYVGNHAVEIVIPSISVVGSQGCARLGMSAKFFRGQKVVLEGAEKNGWPFWGIDSHGFGFIRYSVPKDLPINEALAVEINVHGDIDSFLQENGTAMIKLIKSSDE